MESKAKLSFEGNDIATQKVNQFITKILALGDFLTSMCTAISKPLTLPLLILYHLYHAKNSFYFSFKLSLFPIALIKL